MDPDIHDFIARNAVNIIVMVIYGIRVLFVGSANLYVKFMGFFVLASVFYVGRLVTTTMLGSATSPILFVAVYIGIRLIALKVIFTVIDYED
jgi:hypothetical protein